MMPKSPVEAGKQPLKWLCNEAYYLVRRFIPESVNDKMLAFGLGFASGYGAAYVGAEVVHPYVVEPLTGATLEQTVSHSLAATVAVPVGAKVIAPETVRTWRRQNPVYSSGAIGVMLGASAKALVELL